MPDHPLPQERDSSTEPDLSGQKLGNYQLLRRLGRGGMADVYLAEQLSLQRQVAFKVLKSHLGVDDAYIRRFHNEARAAASLVHANIVQIYEVGCIEGVHFIAQEYVAGQNLKQWLARNGTADTATAVHIMRQVVAALSRAAQQGIIHRDIKPENIMLAKTGEVKVADFGLARIANEGGVGLTQVGVTLGTPLYMSPEQVEGRGVDPRSDLYSFGVTCYEMLAGRPPFEGDTPLSVAVQHLRSDPTPLATLRPDLPAELCQIVHQLLAKAPSARYGSATEVLRALRSVSTEGMEQWSGADWNTPELLALTATNRSAATLQLDSLMRAQARSMLGVRFRVWKIVLPVLAGLAVGVAVAWWHQPADLLTVSSPTVEKLASSKDQYWRAYDLNTEEAWLAVEKYFDQSDAVNRVYAIKAKLRRAELYRSNDGAAAALALYREVAALKDEEPQLAAQALIGQANLLADSQDRRALNSLIAQEALPLLRTLTVQQRQDVLALLDDKSVPPLLDRDEDLPQQIEEMRGPANKGRKE